MGSVCARGSPTAPRPRKPRAIAAAAAPGPTDFLWSSQWSHDWKRPMRPRRRARSTPIATRTGDGTARCGNSPALGESNTTRLVTPSRQRSASDRAFRPAWIRSPVRSRVMPLNASVCGRYVASCSVKSALVPTPARLRSFRLTRSNRPGGSTMTAPSSFRV